MMSRSGSQGTKFTIVTGDVFTLTATKYIYIRGGHRLIFLIKSNHFYCHITTAQVPW